MDDMDKKMLNKMTLRQVVEYSRSIPLSEGGLNMVFERLVSEIENIQMILKDIHKECENVKSFDASTSMCEREENFKNKTDDLTKEFWTLFYKRNKL